MRPGQRRPAQAPGQATGPGADVDAGPPAPPSSPRPPSVPPAAPTPATRLAGDEMTQPNAPAALRPSTTVLLVRDGADGLEVLMVVREDRGQYAKAMVFPGGVVDAEDADEAWLPLADGAGDPAAAGPARRIAGFR